MLRRRRKIRVQRTVYISKDVNTRLENYLANCDFYKSDVVDMALDKFLKEVENEENCNNM